ncbi:hypothetical protein ACLOJK_009402 [Asimina triloba]
MHGLIFHPSPNRLPLAVRSPPNASSSLPLSNEVAARRHAGKEMMLDWIFTLRRFVGLAAWQPGSVMNGCCCLRWWVSVGHVAVGWCVAWTTASCPADITAGGGIVMGGGDGCGASWPWAMEPGRWIVGRWTLARVWSCCRRWWTLVMGVESGSTGSWIVEELLQSGSGRRGGVLVVVMGRDLLWSATDRRRWVAVRWLVGVDAVVCCGRDAPAGSGVELMGSAGVLRSWMTSWTLDLGREGWWTEATTSGEIERDGGRSRSPLVAAVVVAGLGKMMEHHTGASCSGGIPYMVYLQM